MRKSFLLSIAVLCCIHSFISADTFGTGENQFYVDFVTVGNAGNAADTTGYGNVGYEYRIGKYEVTAGQYTAFLNATAATDNFELYNSFMAMPGYDNMGCNIIQSGTIGNYTYSIETDWANHPVNFVNWYDAARFCNFLTSGNTEQGVYQFDLDGNFTGIDNSMKSGSTPVYWIPTENEWYKAAYHKNNGITSNYWKYPLQSDTAPTNGYFLTERQANFGTQGGGMYAPYYTTEVGYFENYDSPYGTFDQGGNLWEWNESLVGDMNRGLRGGSFLSKVDALSKDVRISVSPIADWPYYGFRVASNVVPEPVTAVLLGLGALALRQRKQ